MAYTAEGVASYLKKMNKDYYGNKTWEKMLGDVSLAGQESLENLRIDFGQATGEAYRAAQMNQAAIAGSNVIQGMKSEMFADNELALQEAYDSYLKNFQSGVGAIADTVAQGNADINKLLMSQAQNYADYANAHVDYLYDLWNRYSEGEIDGSFFADSKYGNYMKDVYNDDGTIALDENGMPIRELIGRGELENLIWDANGNMTAAGKMFFEQMESDQLLRNFSFDSYLAQENPELRDWAMSDNPYDYAPNVLGESTMAGTFREMTGRMSNDEVFENIEAFRGMTAGTLNKRIAEFETTMDELLDSDLTDVNNVDVVTKAFSKLLDDVGLKDAYEQQYGDIEDSIDALIDAYVTYKNAYEAGEDAVASSISPGGASYVFNQKYPDAPETKLQPIKDLVIRLADYVKTQHDSHIRNFHDVEKSNGAEIMLYDGTIAKSVDGSHYDYMMEDGSTVSFLSTADSVGGFFNNKKDAVSGVLDKTFNIKYMGETYNVSVGRETMDAATVKQIDSKMRTSVGRGIQAGDVFYDRGKLWVMTTSGEVRVVWKWFNSDYNDLTKLLNAQRTNPNQPDKVTVIPSK